jgi:hypothetical protein
MKVGLTEMGLKDVHWTEMSQHKTQRHTFEYRNKQFLL